MYAVESRLVGELREQREGLSGLMEQRFEGMDATLRDAIRDAAGEAAPTDDPAPPNAAQD
jgi:hypothetical protein